MSPEQESIVTKLERAGWELTFRTLMNNYCRMWWRPRLRNPEALPDKGPCFIYGNHTNRFDPFLLNCFTAWGNPTAGVMTRDRMRSKTLARAFELFSVLPVRKRIAEPGLVRTLRKKLDQGHRIVIYPEGGSRWTGRPEPWIPSTAKVFMRMGAPVYPIFTHGSFASWPRWAKWPRPARVELEVGEPMTFTRHDDPEDGLKRLEAAIAIDGSETPEHLKPKWAYRPADGLHILLYRDPESGEYESFYTTDGTKFKNRSGNLQWKVRPDSMLLDSNGKVINPSKIYDQIKAMPLQADKAGDLLNSDVDLSKEVDWPELRPMGRATAQLRPDVILIKTKKESISIPLEQVLAHDIERNYKFQISTAKDMYQLEFNREGSALSWKDALVRLGVAPL